MICLLTNRRIEQYWLHIPQKIRDPTLTLMKFLKPEESEQNAVRQERSQKLSLKETFQQFSSLLYTVLQDSNIHSMVSVNLAPFCLLYAAPW